MRIEIETVRAYALEGEWDGPPGTSPPIVAAVIGRRDRILWIRGIGNVAAAGAGTTASGILGRYDHHPAIEVFAGETYDLHGEEISVATWLPGLGMQALQIAWIAED